MVLTTREYVGGREVKGERHSEDSRGVLGCGSGGHMRWVLVRPCQLGVACWGGPRWSSAE